MKNFEFSSLPIEQLYQVLQSSPQGISARQASKRMQAQRRASKTKSPFGRERILLIRQFTNPLVLLLVVAVLLSALLGEFADTLIILFILLITGLLGFWQELHAGRAMEKLYKMVEMNSTLVRGGKQQNVPNNEVVMGDVLLLDAGDIIAAACRIIESNELHVDESTLTGESYPVEKSAGERADYLPIHEKTNCVWQGTTVISGMARALVVHTGNDTIFGQMSHSLLQTPETAFEKGIKRFGYFLLRITIVLSLIILLTNLYFKRPFFDSVLFSLALAVGMAPELLPAIMTFAMAAGAKRMMQKQVIVKKLSAIFNFGEVNVLCTDKTGTITQGEVTVNRIINTRGETDDRLRLFAFLNARFQSGYTNPIDRAIALLPLGPTGYEKLNEIPYDFIRKRLSIAVKKQEQALYITKGALLSVLEVCMYVEEVINEIVPISKDFRRKIEESNAHYSQQGYKVLGLAYKAIASEKISRADEQDMIFLGYILLEDPLKQSTVNSIERLKQLDISIKIITGDNRYAAAQIAQELGLNKSHVLTGEELNHLSPEALTVKVKYIAIFAEIAPHQKERIVRALQTSHFTVAYVGDGINDVAAIHAADVGISTSNAVDVAKEAADFVLLEKDLSVLAEGIYEGRKSFANCLKYIFISTGATFGNMLSVAGASLLLPFLPMLPKQILLTNLITDLPFLAIASDQVDKDQLKTPKKWDMPVIRNFMIVFGIHSSIVDFVTFYILYQFFHLSGSLFQTGWFLISTLTEICILFIIRTRHTFIKSKPEKWLLIAAIIAVCVIAYLPVSPFARLLGFTRLPLQPVIASLVIILLYLITADLLKIVFFKLAERRKMF